MGVCGIGRGFEKAARIIAEALKAPDQDQARQNDIRAQLLAPGRRELTNLVTMV